MADSLIEVIFALAASPVGETSPNVSRTGRGVRLAVLREPQIHVVAASDVNVDVSGPTEAVVANYE